MTAFLIGLIAAAVALCWLGGFACGRGQASEDHEAAEQAVRLLEEVFFLRVNGERPPGGNETWRDLDPRVEIFLREYRGYID